MSIASWFIIVITTVITAGRIFLTMLYRMAIAALLAARSGAQAVSDNKVIMVAVVGMFAVGIPLQVFQQEIMTAMDIPYECGAYPAAQIFSSFLRLIFVTPYEFIAPIWNDIWIEVIDFFVGLGSEISAVTRVKHAVHFGQAVSSVASHLLDSEFAEIGAVLTEIANAFGEYFGGWGEFGGDVIDYFGSLGVAMFVDGSVFSSSCTFCSADPNPNECAIRDMAISVNDGEPYDCDECKEFIADLFGLLGGLVDAISGGFLKDVTSTTSFRRIFRAVGCVVRSMFLMPIYIVAGLISTCLNFADDVPALLEAWWIGGMGSCSSTGYGTGYGSVGHTTNHTKAAACCGKPGGCDFPTGGSGEELPIGIVPCLGELMAAMTGDKFDDFIELILSFFLPIVGDTVHTIERIDHCFSRPIVASCFANYVVQTQGELGTCKWSYGPDESVYGTTKPTFGQCERTGSAFPTGGLHECFDLVNECLQTNTTQNAPFLVGFGDVFDFLLRDLWRYGLDLIACPVINLIDKLVQALGVQGLAGAFNDLSIENPVFGPLVCGLANVLHWVGNIIDTIYGWILKVIRFFGCVGDCSFGNVVAGDFVNCFEGGSVCENDELLDEFGNRMRRDAMPLSVWQSHLDKWGVGNETFCAHVLNSCTPEELIESDWGKYSTYMMCIGMYGVRRSTEVSCGTTAHRNSTATPLGDTLDTLNNCTVLQEDEFGLGRFVTDDMVMSARTRTISSASRIFGLGNGTLTGWSIIDKFIKPTWGHFMTTGYYRRANEFYQTYRKKMEQVEQIPEGTPEREEAQTALTAVYVEFANDVLHRVHTGTWLNETMATQDALPDGRYQFMSHDNKLKTTMTEESMRALPSKVWERMAEIGIVEPTEAMQRDQLPSRINATTRMTFDIVDGEMGLTHRSWFQTIAGTVRAIRRRDPRNAWAMIRGTKKYLMSQDKFISDRAFKYHQERMEQDLLPNGAQRARSLIRTITRTETYNTRTPRMYAPFPILYIPPSELNDEYTPEISWQERARTYMTERHAHYMESRTISLTGTPSAIRTTPSADFDANQWVYDRVDDVLSLFVTSVEGILNAAVAGLVAFWNSFDFQRFTSDNIEDTFLRFFSCAIPENIDGNGIYSPACFMLANEGLFNMLAPVTGTSGAFPPQLPWPEALVTKQCKSEYTGDPSIFTFKFSDNCQIPNLETYQKTCATTGCSGALHLKSQYAIANRTVVRMEATQVVPASISTPCKVDQILTLTPSCAEVLSVHVASGSLCSVTGVSYVDNATNYASTCSTPVIPIPLPNIRLLRISLDFPLNTTCALDITYNKGVEFSTADASLLISNTGTTQCGNCELRLPATVCSPSGRPLVDMYPTQRPFCDSNECGATCLVGGCDYCDREYRGCGDAGFADVLDTFLYFTGVLPFAIDELVFGGLDTKSLQLLVGITYGVFLYIFMFPVNIIVVGIPFFMALASWVHIQSWFFHIFFGGQIPWPMLTMGMTIFVTARKPQLHESLLMTLLFLVAPGFPFYMRLAFISLVTLAQWGGMMRRFIKPIMFTNSLSFTIYAASLIQDIPKFSTWMRLNDWIGKGLLMIDDSYFFFFIDVTPVMARAEQYQYNTLDDVPDVATFCSKWMISNMAMLGLMSVIAYWPVSMLGKWVWAGVLAGFETVLMALDVRRQILLQLMRQQAMDMAYESEAAEEAEEDATTTTTDDVRSYIGRTFHNARVGSRRIVRSLIREMVGREEYDAEMAMMRSESRTHADAPSPAQRGVSGVPVHSIATRASAPVAASAAGIRRRKNVRVVDDDSSSSDNTSDSESEVDSDAVPASMKTKKKPAPVVAASAGRARSMRPTVLTMSSTLRRTPTPPSQRSTRRTGSGSDREPIPVAVVTDLSRSRSNSKR